MADPYEEYTKELYKKFGYFGTWLPGTPYRVGDVGILQNKYWFKRVTTLDKLGIQVEIRPDGTSDNLDFTSSSGVSIGFKAQGEVPSAGSHLQQASAGITVEFSKEHGIVFRLKGCTYLSIEDQVTLSQTILERFKTGNWNRDWVVITQLVVAEAATIVMSKSNNAKIEITAGAKIKTPSDGDMASADAELKVAFQSSMETSYVASQNLTPLFLASGVRDDQFIAMPMSLGATRALERLTPAEIAAGAPLAQGLTFGRIGVEQYGAEAQQGDWRLEESEVPAGAP
jgi:hypothetical protein